MKKLLFLITIIAISLPALAQKRTVVGTVYDANDGIPLPGVSIVIPGTNDGVASNMDGNFIIRLEPNVNSLQFSFIGYETTTVNIKGKTKLKVQLKSSQEKLDEVVVVGYGKQSKKDVVGAIKKVEVAELAASIPAESVESLLQGQIAGVNIQMNSGEPGAAPIIMVRGLGKISRNSKNVTSAPLFVVDGVPFISEGDEGSNVMSDIDPNDIADITVLKDASASAIYGSRAINGVIMITTKKGKSGRPQVTLSTKLGFNIPGQRRKILGGNAERRKKVELYKRFNPELEMPMMLTDSLNPYWNNSTDWQKEKYRVSAYQDYNLAIRGAGEFGNYSISIGHYNNKGTVVNTGYKRNNFMIRNSLYALNKRLSVNSVIAFTRTNNDRRVSIAEPSLTTSLQAPISSPVYKGFGDIPDAMNKSTRDRFRANMNVKFYFTKDLNFESKLSANLSRNNSSEYYPIQIASSLKSSESTAESYEYDGRNYMVENVLTYLKLFNKKHLVSVMIGQSREFNEALKVQTQGDRRQSFTQTASWDNSISKGYTTYDAYGMSSFYSRFTYRFDEKYLINATIRADGSSKFGDDNKWGYFPSIGLGYVFTNEKFLKNKILTFGKLRASYGEVGGQFSQNYLAQGIMESSSNYIGGLGFTPKWKDGYRNRDLTWEQSQTWDLGIDLTFFDERVEISADYYYKTTKGNLMDLALANTSGYETVYKNASDIVNKGYELTIETVNIENKNFRWETNFNFASNKNYIKTIYGGDEDIVRIEDDGTSVIRVGKPANGFYFYQGEGIYQGWDEIPVNPKTGKPMTGINGEKLQPGDKRYKDVNGDYKLDYRDRVYSGSPNPTVVGGFNNQFYYKNWYLYVNCSFIYDRDVINSSALSEMKLGSSFYGGSLPDLSKYDIWEKPGDNAKYPSINPWNERSQVYLDDSDYIEDGSYFKVKSITLGYTFGKSFLKKLRLRNLRCFGTITNIHTFQNYSGPDAEMVSSAGYDTSSGYPAPFTIVGGVSIGF